QAAVAGRFGAADSLLADFAQRYPSTNEAAETGYWRAVFQLDPGAHTPSLAAPMALLDAYLAAKEPREHAVEATSVRRLAGQLDAVRQALGANAQQMRDAAAAANARS